MLGSVLGTPAGARRRTGGRAMLQFMPQPPAPPRLPEVPKLDAARADAVCQALGIRMLVLFGSRVTGSPPPDSHSDLDIAISLAAPRQRMGLWEYHEPLGRLFPGESLDLSFLDGADPLFRWEIMRRSVLLWGDPDAYCEMRAFAYRDFTESADLFALERTLAERKLAHVRRLVHAAP